MPSFYDCLCVFALFANAGAVWTAWLITPKFKLFPYRLPTKVHWLLRLFFLSSAFLSYWHPELVVTIISMALLSAASNAAQIPLSRALGEEAVVKMAIENASKESFWPGLLVRIFPALFYGLFALFIFSFFPKPETWGYWIALGVAYYSIGHLISRPKAYLRYRKLGRAISEAKQ